MAGVETLATAPNDFAVELWRQTPAGNYVISPVSIAATLAMAWTGARGDTAEEMRRVLHLDNDVESVALAFGAMARDLRSDELAIANRLFGDRRYVFERPFQTRLAGGVCRTHGSPGLSRGSGWRA